MDGLGLIRGCHAEGLTLLSEALTHDESGETVAALASYRQGLAVMNAGLEVRCDLTGCVGHAWTDARKLQREMRQHGMQARARVKLLERLERAGSAPEMKRNSPPPPYSETDTNSIPPRPPPYSEFPEPPSSRKTSDAHYPDATPPATIEPSSSASDCGKDAKEKTLYSPEWRVEVTRELFRIDDGVRVFRVNPSTQEVFPNSDSVTSALVIYKLPTPRDQQENFNCLEHILQVDDWIFPLSQRVLSPILKTSDNTYMFPDLGQEVSSVSHLATETAVGLVLDPNAVALDIKYVFEECLHDLALLLTREEAESLGLVGGQSDDRIESSQLNATAATSHHRVQPRGALAADFVARGMLTGASTLSQGLVKGAQLAGSGIRRGSEMLREKIEPLAAPIAVDPKVKFSVDVAKRGSQAAVVAGGFVLEKLGDATMFVGRKVSPVVKTQANKYLPEKYRIGGESSERGGTGRITATDKALTVISGGLEGFVTVYQGLEAAGRILASSIADESVKLIDRRFGSEVAETASGGLEAVGNIGYAGYLSGAFGAKALAKRVARSTGRALLEDYGVAKTQPHFYDEYLEEKTKTDVKLEEFVGKPIRLTAVDEIVEERGKKLVVPSVEELEDATSPVLSTGAAKLELCEEVVKDLNAEGDDFVSRSSGNDDRRRIDEARLLRTDGNSDPCLESEY